LPITTKVVSSNPVHGEVYSIQHYVIKFVSDLRCFFPDKWHDEISKEKHYVRLEMVPSFTLTCNRNRMCMCMRISLSINL
jgi:hypothetical protein